MILKIRMSRHGSLLLNTCPADYITKSFPVKVGSIICAECPHNKKIDYEKMEVECDYSQDLKSKKEQFVEYVLKNKLPINN